MLSSVSAPLFSASSVCDEPQPVGNIAADTKMMVERIFLMSVSCVLFFEGQNYDFF